MKTFYYDSAVIILISNIIDSLISYSRIYSTFLHFIYHHERATHSSRQSETEIALEKMTDGDRKKRDNILTFMKYFCYQRVIIIWWDYKGPSDVGSGGVCDNSLWIDCFWMKLNFIILFAKAVAVRALIMFYIKSMFYSFITFGKLNQFIRILFDLENKWGLRELGAFICLKLTFVKGLHWWYKFVQSIFVTF